MVESDEQQKFPFTCPDCGIVYCSKKCKKKHKEAHKLHCSVLQMHPSDRMKIVQSIVYRFIQLFSCFAVAKYLAFGKGILLITSKQKLKDFREGVNMPDRALQVSFVGWEEFFNRKNDSNAWKNLVENVKKQENYNPKTHFVAILETSCGYCTVLHLGLFPDFETCTKRTENYAKADALNIKL